MTSFFSLQFEGEFTKRSMGFSMLSGSIMFFQVFMCFCAVSPPSLSPLLLSRSRGTGAVGRAVPIFLDVLRRRTWDLPWNTFIPSSMVPSKKFELELSRVRLCSGVRHASMTFTRLYQSCRSLLFPSCYTFSVFENIFPEFSFFSLFSQFN